MLIVIDNFNEIDVRILFQFFENGMENRQSFARVFGGVPHVQDRNESGHGCGRYLYMNVGTPGTEFVDVNADHAFMEGIGAKYECAQSESCFRE